MAADKGGPPQKKTKLTNKKMAIYGGVGFLVFIIWLGLQPLRGPMEFGLCRVFLEQQVTYPTEMTINDVFVFTEPGVPGNTILIEYTEVNPFGNNTRGRLTCVFAPNPNPGSDVGMILAEADLNGADISTERLTRFNRSIPGILANPPSLNLPLAIPDGLENLQNY